MAKLHQQIMIVAGEPSGDAHAARLVTNLKLQQDNLKFYGMGGNAMANAGVELIQNIQKTSVMGIVELLTKLPYLYSVLFKLRWVLQNRPPELLILVDYQAFNLKLAKMAKKLGIKTLFYIGPQVWAWRSYRVKKIKKIINHMAVIFPFEVDFYQQHNMMATYVGHPLINNISSNLSKADFFALHNISEDKKLIVFLPGSRSSEIINHLPIFQAAIKRLSTDTNLVFAVSRYDKSNPKIAEIFANLPANIKIIDDNYHAMINAADFAVVASGTATLETALLKTPMIMVVKVAKLSYAIYKRMIQTPYIAIVNIIANKQVITELVQEQATANNIANLVSQQLNDPTKLTTIQAGFAEINHKLTVKPKNNLTSVVLKMLAEA